MSLKLLKQSIEILESNDYKISSTLEKANKVSKVIKTKNSKSKKIEKSKSKQSNKVKSTDSIYQFDNRKLDKIRQDFNSKNDKVNANMKRLLALSQNSIKVADAKKMVNRAHKGRNNEIKLPKIEQESIFTEEDFLNFEREYFS